MAQLSLCVTEKSESTLSGGWGRSRARGSWSVGAFAQAREAPAANEGCVRSASFSRGLPPVVTGSGEQGVNRGAAGLRRGGRGWRVAAMGWVGESGATRQRLREDHGTSQRAAENFLHVACKHVLSWPMTQARK